MLRAHQQHGGRGGQLASHHLRTYLLSCEPNIGLDGVPEACEQREQRYRRLRRIKMLLGMVHVAAPEVSFIGKNDAYGRVGRRRISYRRATHPRPSWDLERGPGAGPSRAPSISVPGRGLGVPQPIPCLPWPLRGPKGENGAIAGLRNRAQISNNAIARCFNAADAGFGCPTGL